MDYRHVIHSLVKKPRAFRSSQLRDDLLPNDLYRSIWQMIDETMSPDAACKMMVGLLHLAATNDCEEALGNCVLEALTNGQTISLPVLQKQMCQKPESPHLKLEIKHASLESYQHLIPSVSQNTQRMCHHG